MVELFRTAVAAHAVVAIPMHLAVADETLPDHSRRITCRQLLVDHHAIDWILRSQVDIVVTHCHQQHEVKSQHSP